MRAWRHCVGHRNWAAWQELPRAVIVMANSADSFIRFDDPDCSEDGSVLPGL